MAQTQKLLEIQNVSKIFRIGGMLMGKKLTAIDDVSLDIDAGKPVILSIVGESGCGKSTLCKMILRLYKPDMGDIRLLGNSYADKKAYNPKQFKLDVQPIFQNPYESFSARKTVDTYLFNTALRLGICKNHAEAEKVVDETLRSVGMSLAVVKDKYPTQFSGSTAWASISKSSAFRATCWRRFRSSSPAACASARSSRSRRSCPRTWCSPTSRPRRSTSSSSAAS